MRCDLAGGHRMQDLHVVRVRESLRALLATLRRATAEIDETLTQLGTDGDIPVTGSIVPARRPAILQVDRETFAIRSGTKTCHLGHTILFRVMDVLVRHPDQYVSREQLLDLAWQGTRADSTVRSAIGELRARLVEAGLPEVAAAIEGQNPGHYCLRVTQTPSRKKSNSDPSRIRQQSDSNARG